MKAINDLQNSANSLNVSTEDEKVIASNNSYVEPSRDVAMSRYEANNKLEQNYYNKASGCSVKAQKDNLFDYSSFVKI
ncbi:hypothetical protein [Flavobacterium sp.]|uniref:hypothetical protein n=1 Tax=Flavobacterium sp. TaxID=239 RepID=UPI00286D8220|nr:hypothetical protein [Flavobacterium sp.]